MRCQCDLMNVVVNVSLEGRFFCSSLCINDHLYHLVLRGEVCRFENQLIGIVLAVFFMIF